MILYYIILLGSNKVISQDLLVNLGTDTLMRNIRDRGCT
eukprot:SAG31_NODE_31165_length_371_cov_0.941176_1_plen_38_part_10